MRFFPYVFLAATATAVVLAPLPAHSDIFTEYGKLKNDIQNALNIDYSLDMTFMPQIGTSDGGKTAYQTIYSPSVTWNAWSSDKYGSGTFNFVYTRTQYISAANGNDLSGNLNVATPVNDYGETESNFDQLSYTQTLPGNEWSLTLGQYPMYNFDGGTYDSNQMTNFINYALSQNATSSYPTAGLGAYVQYSPTSSLTMAAGFQDAGNVDGININFHTFSKGKFLGFGYVSWSPTIKGLGSSQYTLLYYNQPSVPAQIGNSEGWSFNMTQNITDKWGVFARFNTVTGNVETLDSSIVLGAVYNNPLGRNANDQIGLAFAFNSVNKNVAAANVGTKVGSSEKIIEGFWTWAFSDYVTVTPDIQFYINPALDTKQDTATVFSLRLGIAL